MHRFTASSGFNARLPTKFHNAALSGRYESEISFFRDSDAWEVILLAVKNVGPGTALAVDATLSYEKSRAGV